MYDFDVETCDFQGFAALQKYVRNKLFGICVHRKAHIFVGTNFFEFVLMQKHGGCVLQILISVLALACDSAKFGNAAYMVEMRVREQNRLDFRLLFSKNRIYLLRVAAGVYHETDVPVYDDICVYVKRSSVKVKILLRSHLLTSITPSMPLICLTSSSSSLARYLPFRQP